MRKFLSFLLGLSVALMASNVPLAHAATLNTVIKGSSPTVYWLASDGKRYAFPNIQTYWTWFPDFSNVNVVSDKELLSYQMGGYVTYRPGSRLIKLANDPKVYVVTHYGILHWIPSEVLASMLYDANWSKRVDVTSQIAFSNYQIGSPVINSWDVNVGHEYNSVQTPSDNLAPALPGAYTDAALGSLTVTKQDPTSQYGVINFKAILTHSARVPTAINLYDLAHGNRLVWTCALTSDCIFQLNALDNPSFYGVARAYDGVGGYVESNQFSFERDVNKQILPIFIPSYQTWITSDSPSVTPLKPLTLRAFVNAPQDGLNVIENTHFDIRLRDSYGNILQTCRGVSENVACVFQSMVSIPAGTGPIVFTADATNLTNSEITYPGEVLVGRY